MIPFSLGLYLSGSGASNEGTQKHAQLTMPRFIIRTVFVTLRTLNIYIHDIPRAFPLCLGPNALLTLDHLINPHTDKHCQLRAQGAVL